MMRYDDTTTIRRYYYMIYLVLYIVYNSIYRIPPYIIYNHIPLIPFKYCNCNIKQQQEFFLFSSSFYGTHFQLSTGRRQKSTEHFWRQIPRAFSATWTTMMFEIHGKKYGDITWNLWFFPQNFTITLPETNIVSPLKMMVSNRNLLFQMVYFQGIC